MMRLPLQSALLSRRALLPIASDDGTAANQEQLFKAETSMAFNALITSTLQVLWQVSPLPGLYLIALMGKKWVWELKRPAPAGGRPLAGGGRPWWSAPLARTG